MTTPSQDEMFPYEKLFPVRSEYLAFLNGLQAGSLTSRMFRGDRDEIEEHIREGAEAIMEIAASNCNFSVSFSEPTSDGWRKAIFKRAGIALGARRQ